MFKMNAGYEWVYVSVSRVPTPFLGSPLLPTPNLHAHIICSSWESPIRMLFAACGNIFSVYKTRFTARTSPKINVTILMT